MAAYTYQKDDLDLEIFRVDKQRGRWLAIGSLYESPLTFKLIAYMDVLPDGVKPMNPEAVPYREMVMEAFLKGEKVY